MCASLLHSKPFFNLDAPLAEILSKDTQKTTLGTHSSLPYEDVLAILHFESTAQNKHPPYHLDEVCIEHFVISARNQVT